MNEQLAQKSRNWKPLLLIPAVLIVAKAASQRRMRWETSAGPNDGPHRHGRHGFGRRNWIAEDGTFRLPPKVEAMLDAWHTAAHESNSTTEVADVTTA